MMPEDRQICCGKPVKHESAWLHVTGSAHFIDDIPLPPTTLHVALGMSAMAHALICRLDLEATRAAPGVVAVFTAADLPGKNNYSPTGDDPLLAEREVQYVGQPLFAVAATSYENARRAVMQARIDYEPLAAILDISSAVAQASYLFPAKILQRGDPQTLLGQSPHRLQGAQVIGGQDHFYLEGQIAAAIPGDDGAMLIYSSTQHPSEAQRMVAHALNRGAHEIQVQCRRIGGGFGGKETQSALFAALAAVVAQSTGRPTKLRLDRDTDMLMTGKRHDFMADYDVGFDPQGRILALDVKLFSRCGYSADLSAPVNDRAMFHVDNCYFLEHVRIVSHRCRTHTVSNTACRGFGGPQGMMVIETIMDDIGRKLGIDPLDVRRVNFYGVEERNTTPYWMCIEDNIIHRVIDDLEISSNYRKRRIGLKSFNEQNPIIKKGIALTPVKFGISFTTTHYNQAGALVHVYSDGTVLVNHGGTEMGQGLHTKVVQVVADEFGLPMERVRVSATDTGKVPNTSATAASSGSDLNGMAARTAAQTLCARMIDFASGHFGVEAQAIHFRAGKVWIGADALLFEELVALVYLARISLSATGYYRTPKIHYDKESMRGRPFYYFSYGAAVSEVAIDTLNGEYRLLRVDILHDVGHSLNPALDLGQIEGGFTQGMGWLTSEELWWNESGELKTHAPSTYKIPAADDWPLEWNIRTLENAPNRETTVFRSKAVGEPPLMLAISVFHALRDAVAQAAGVEAAHALKAPATPEAVLAALNAGKEKNGWGAQAELTAGTGGAG